MSQLEDAINEISSLKFLDGAMLGPIPNHIHQIWPDKARIPPEIAACIKKLRNVNPNWGHTLYGDSDIHEYVNKYYGPNVNRFLNVFSADYGVCKADLFRYLVIYREGGVYLDAKSTSVRSLDNLISPDDVFILSQWTNLGIQDFEGYGRWRELASIAGGEYHNWHIISAPGHPFLRAVLISVLNNIASYNPWICGAGQRGVLKLTGPIAYTPAISPIIHLYPHRFINIDKSGLQYSVFPNNNHLKLIGKHYTNSKNPITNISRVSTWVFRLYFTIILKLAPVAKQLFSKVVIKF